MKGLPRRPRVAAIQQTLCAAGTLRHVHFLAMLTSGYFGAGSLSLTGDLIDKLDWPAETHARLRRRDGRGLRLLLRHLAPALRANLHREALQTAFA
jgi:hypothetical protein